MSVSLAQGVVAVSQKQILAGDNITTSETETTITISSTGGSGGGTITFVDATLDFGVGSNEAQASITGQTGILATSKAWAVVSSDAVTTDHTSSDHRYFQTLVGLTCSTPTDGVGFVVYATSIHSLTGTFKVRCCWV